MKTIVKFVLTAGVITGAVSNTSIDYSSYEGMHWDEGIVAEVQAHYPEQKVVPVEQPDDTGDIAAVILVIQS